MNRGTSGPRLGHAPAVERPLVRTCAGNAYVEALLVIPIILLLITGIGQLTLMWSAKLGVVHAANAAVRAAIVVLDDDPRLFGGEPRNLAPTGSLRHAEIKRAAAGALVGVGSEPWAANPALTFEDALVQRDLTLPLPALLTPSEGLSRAVEVWFPGRPEGRFGLRETVTVRVAHGFSCLVPIARWVVCGGESRVQLAADASLPNQGAPYRYEGPVLGAWLGEQP